MFVWFSYLLYRSNFFRTNYFPPDSKRKLEIHIGRFLIEILAENSEQQQKQTKLTQSTQLFAEREGFEPSVPVLAGTHDFQSCSLGQLGHLSRKHVILTLKPAIGKSFSNRKTVFTPRFYSRFNDGCMVTGKQYWKKGSSVVFAEINYRNNLLHSLDLKRAKKDIEGLLWRTQLI